VSDIEYYNTNSTVLAAAASAAQLPMDIHFHTLIQTFVDSLRKFKEIPKHKTMKQTKTIINPAK
jgi:hypothetical protein